MSQRIEKPWRPLTGETIDGVSGQLGVFQISNDAKDILYIGYAGGRSRWGLRGLLAEQRAAFGPGHHFRIEVNQQYLSRWEELLKIHKGDHGALPPGNKRHRPRHIGRLSTT